MTARAMLLAAEIFTPAHMAAQGFLTHVVPAFDLDSATESLAQRIAAMAPQAARLNKQTLRALKAGRPVATPFSYADSPEHHEGITAFIEKRPPQF